MNVGPKVFIKITNKKIVPCEPLHKIDASPLSKNYSMHIIPRYKH
ncbi:MAG: hypothetical protein WC748_08835 [Legionellales bacterium]|jgi:hypothetical protein